MIASEGTCHVLLTCRTSTMGTPRHSNLGIFTDHEEGSAGCHQLQQSSAYPFDMSLTRRVGGCSSSPFLFGAAAQLPFPLERVAPDLVVCARS